MNIDFIVNSPAVNLSLTTDFSKMLATLASITISGSLNFAGSIRIAKLALKRFSMEGTPNRRIIAFVASPLLESREELVKLGEELKKSNVAVDIVNFGEQAVNTEKLDAFIAAVNKENNSRLVTIPPGPHLLSDMVLKSPIIAREGGSSALGVSGGDASAEFDFDPSMDPELAMAIRLSLEEENRRKQKESGVATSTTQPSSSTSAPQPTVSEEEMFDEDEELQRAIALSRQLAEGDVVMEETEHDETTGLLHGKDKQPSGNPDQNISDLLDDEDYLNSVISQLKKDEKKDEKKEDKESKK